MSQKFKLECFGRREISNQITKTKNWCVNFDLNTRNLHIFKFKKSVRVAKTSQHYVELSITMHLTHTLHHPLKA